MLEVKPFEATDIRGLQVQSMQALDQLSPELARQLVGPLSFTGWDDGEPLICAGVAELWPGRGMAWSLVSMNAGRRMRAIHAAVQRILDIAPFRRVECYVDAEFPAGMRWARLLGFRCETPVPMPYFFESGRDAYLWSRIR